MASLVQLGGSYHSVTNLKYKHSLNAIDTEFIAPIQFILNYLQHLVMCSLNQINSL